MNGGIDGWVDVVGRMDVWIKEMIKGWKVGRMYRWMVGWTDRWQVRMDMDGVIEWFYILYFSTI